MHKIRIGIDIDEVLAEFVRLYLPYVNKKEKKQVTYEDIKSYRLWEAYGIEKVLAYNYAEEINNSEYFKEISVVPGAKESIAALKEKFDIIFLTARTIKIKKQTEEFIEQKIGVEKALIYFTGDDYHNKNKERKKGELCSDLGIKYLVEDNIDFFKDSFDNGTKILLLDKPWNRGISHKNLVRFNDWKEIVNYLEKKHA